MPTDMLQSIETLIYDIQTAIDPYSIQIKNNTLNSTQLTDYNYLSEIFCNSKGKIEDNTNMVCNCDLGFFQSHCSVSGKFYWGSGWIAFRVILGLCYLLLSGFIWYYLNIHLNDEFGSFKKKFLRLIYTPKYLVLLNLLIVCNVRTVYVLLDPLTLEDIVGRVPDKILKEINFATCFSIITILLTVWIALYTAYTLDPVKQTNINNENKKKKFNLFLWFKRLNLFIFLVSYPVQFAFSYFRAIRKTYSLVINLLSALTLMVLFFVILFAYYTCKLRRNLNYNYKHSPNKKKNICSKSDRKLEITGTKYHDYLVLKKQMKEKNIVNLIVNSIANNNTFNWNDNDFDENSELYFEEEMRKIDLNNDDNGSNHKENEKDIINGSGTNRNREEVENILGDPYSIKEKIEDNNKIELNLDNIPGEYGENIEAGKIKEVQVKNTQDLKSNRKQVSFEAEVIARDTARNKIKDANNRNNGINGINGNNLNNGKNGENGYNGYNGYNGNYINYNSKEKMFTDKNDDIDNNGDIKDKITGNEKKEDLTYHTNCRSLGLTKNDMKILKKVSKYKFNINFTFLIS